MSVLWLALAAVCVSFCLTWLVRRYAMSRNLVDVPNERSSHQVTTTRGGGLAIVLTFIGGLIVLQSMNLVQPPLLMAIYGGGGLVATIGFVDDHRHIPAHWRLLVHFLSAGWALYWFGGAPAITLGPMLIPAWVVTGLAAVCVVWLVNLYNFMDGIDGIASIEAITVCFGAALMYFIAEPSGRYWVAPVLLLASAAGFLYWNYPPARIFMGDVGSGFLGYTLSVFCVQAAWMAAEMLWAWVILLGVFVVDATLTLLRRTLGGHRLHESHRSHGYQHASRIRSAHEPVSLAIGGINLIWLLPIALLVAFGLLDGVFGFLIAYTPLIVLALKFKSGADELQTS